MKTSTPVPTTHHSLSRRWRTQLAGAAQLVLGVLALTPARALAETSPFASPAPGAVATCRPGARTLCLYGGRIRARVEWDSAPANPRAQALGATAGVFFESAGGPGLVVRVADGRAQNGHFWLLLAAPPDRSYRLNLADLATGAAQTYTSGPGRPAESDLLALPAEPPADSSPTATAGEAGTDGVTMKATSAGIALDGDPVDDGTVAFRPPASRDPELIASTLDGRAVDGSWWLLAAAAHAGAWNVELTDRGAGRVATVHVEAAAAGTLWVPSALNASPAVNVILDTRRAVKATITPTGGSIQAVAANGTKFTLSIPPQALAFTEDITLTPIKSAQHLPFTPGLVAGVEISPAELRFATPARLAIQPPQPVPLPQETTFAYRSGGAQFFLYPANLGSRPVSLSILHTGGYGLARGLAAEQTAQGKRLPIKAEDQFDQRLWHEHWQLRQGLKSAVADDEAEDLGVGEDGALEAGAPEAGGSDLAFFMEDYTKSLEPTLDDIAASCDGLKKWGYYARNFITKAIGDGLSNQLSGEIGALRYAITHGEAHCYEDATQACIGGDHTQPVPALQWWNQLVQDGATSLVDPQKLTSCLVFDLEWDTLLLHSNPAPEGYLISASHRIDTHATVRFRITSSGSPVGRSQPTPNNYESAKWLGGAPKHCTITATGLTQPDNFTVAAMQLDVNLYEDNPPPPKIDLVYSTGNPQMQLAQTCTPGGTTKSYQGLFAPAYLVLHFLEEPLVSPIGGGGLYSYEPVPATWQVKQSALWAVRTYDDTLSFGTNHVQESTDLFLFHKPGT